MTGKMKSAYMTDIKKIGICENDIPAIKDDQVLIKVKHVGICGSDLHFFEFGRISDLVVKPPFILGHEAGGEIVEVGKNVETLKPGDKVAIEPGIPCGKCDYCREGRYNLCEKVLFWAAPPIQGCLSEYVSFPADMCFKIPKNMTTLDAAMVEPLSVGLYAVKQSGYKLGDTAVILGSGCIGICTMLALKAAGITNTIVVDVLENRLAYAKKLGARYTVNADKQNVMETIMRITNGKGADLVFEMAGIKPTIQSTVYLAKRGATIIMVGMATNAEVSIDFGQVIFKELTIKSVFRYKNMYKVAIKLISQGIIKVSDIVTDKFSFNDCHNAFEKCITDKKNIIKGVIEY